MREKLKEMVQKAAAQPASQPELSLLYERGHDLSGTIRFEAAGNGRFSLASNVTAGRKPGQWQGVLSAAQRSALFAAAAQGLFDAASSTRPIGDDEQPVFVTVRAGDLSHKLTLWHGDAATSAGFRAFEKALLSLSKELSGGAIIATAD